MSRSHARLPCGMLLLALLASVSLRPAQTGTTILSRRYQTSSQSSNGSTSSSSGREELKEEVVAVTPEGTEVRIDLPDSSTAEERKREWLLPARLFYPRSGLPRRLDSADAERRLADRLTAAGLEPKACGTWYFTWNAFKVECDPNAIIAVVAEYRLRSIDAQEGALLRDAMASEPAALRKDGKALVASFTLDPVTMRRSSAASDVVVGQITGQPVTLEKALGRRERSRGPL